jgi:hypothetical protein
VAFGNETYKLNLKKQNCKYDSYTKNLAGVPFGRYLHNQLLLSGYSKRFTGRPLGCALKKQNHPRTVRLLNADRGEER